MEILEAYQCATKFCRTFRCLLVGLTRSVPHIGCDFRDRQVSTMVHVRPGEAAPRYRGPRPGNKRGESRTGPFWRVVEREAPLGAGFRHLPRLPVRHPLGSPWGCIISDFRLQIADFRLQISDCRLQIQIADCRFQISECRLQSAECRLQISDSDSDCRFQIADFRLSDPSHATKEENKSIVPMYIGTEVAEKIKIKSSICFLSATSAPSA